MEYLYPTGYWFYTNEWEYISPDADNLERLSFIVGLVEMFTKVAWSRRQPDLVQYLMDNPPTVHSATRIDEPRTFDT